MTVWVPALGRARNGLQMAEKIKALGLVGRFGWKHPNGHYVPLWKGYRVTKTDHEEIVNGADYASTAELLMWRRFPGLLIKRVDIPWEDGVPTRTIADILKRGKK